MEALWSVLTKVSVSDIQDNLFFQLVIDHIFEELVKKEFHTSSTLTAPRKSLTCNKQNIFRYVGGCYSTALEKVQEDSEKAARFVECLSHMAINGNESSLMDYTKEWIKTTNCGGLFELTIPSISGD